MFQLKVTARFATRAAAVALTACLALSVGTRTAQGMPAPPSTPHPTTVIIDTVTVELTQFTGGGCVTWKGPSSPTLTVYPGDHAQIQRVTLTCNGNVRLEYWFDLYASDVQNISGRPDEVKTIISLSLMQKNSSGVWTSVKGQAFWPGYNIYTGWPIGTWKIWTGQSAQVTFGKGIGKVNFRASLRE